VIVHEGTAEERRFIILVGFSWDRESDGTLTCGVTSDMELVNSTKSYLILISRSSSNSIKQGNLGYQTSPAVCNSTLNSINLSPINAKLTLFSYVHVSIYIFVSPPMYIVTIVTMVTATLVLIILSTFLF